MLRNVKTPAGKPLVDGKNVTGFTNGEEADVGLTRVVPFLVEDEPLGLGATYSKVKNWGVYTIKDDLLITDQNPASSGPAANVLIDTLNALGHARPSEARGNRPKLFDFPSLVRRPVCLRPFLVHMEGQRRLAQRWRCCLRRATAKAAGATLEVHQCREATPGYPKLPTARSQVHRLAGHYGTALERCAAARSRAAQSDN